jgi:hypothetical protein
MAKIGQKELYTKCGKPLAGGVFGGFAKENANVLNVVVQSQITRAGVLADREACRRNSLFKFRMHIQLFSF